MRLPRGPRGIAHGQLLTYTSACHWLPFARCVPCAKRLVSLAGAPRFTRRRAALDPLHQIGQRCLLDGEAVMMETLRVE
jgi:hypothetical protein